MEELDPNQNSAVGSNTNTDQPQNTPTSAPADPLSTEVNVSAPVQTVQPERPQPEASVQPAQVNTPSAGQDVSIPDASLSQPAETPVPAAPPENIVGQQEQSVLVQETSTLAPDLGIAGQAQVNQTNTQPTTSLSFFSRFKLIIIIAAVVILAGGGYFIYRTISNNSANNATVYPLGQ